MFAYSSDEQTRSLIAHTVHRTRESGFESGPVQEWLDSLPVLGDDAGRSAALAATELAMREFDKAPGEEDPAILGPVPDNVSSWDLHGHMDAAWVRCGAPGVEHVLDQAGTDACQGAALLQVQDQVNLEAARSPQVQRWNAYVLARIQDLEVSAGRAAPAETRPAPGTGLLWVALAALTGVVSWTASLAIHPFLGVAGAVLVLIMLAYGVLQAGSQTEQESDYAVSIAVALSTLAWICGLASLSAFTTLPDPQALLGEQPLAVGVVISVPVVLLAWKGLDRLLPWMRDQPVPAPLTLTVAVLLLALAGGALLLAMASLLGSFGVNLTTAPPFIELPWAPVPSAVPTGP